MLTQKMKQPFKTAQPVLFPPLADRAAWESLPGAARWAAAGQAALADAQTAPELPLSLWLQFTRSGDRAKWEHAYFARRRTLCALAMAEAVTNRGTYLPALADLAWRICEESAWQLPAHNSYIRDTPQLPLPDVTRPIVDLFAAETGALIATVCGLLGEALDAYAPGLAARLRGEVERRVLTPYRTAHFWWMGNGDEPMCNWTPWCTQNVLLAAAQCAPAEDLPAYVQQAAYSIDCFLKDYGDDGCCSEGAQYYRHAALTMFNALDLLCKMAPGVFDDVWAEPKIRNMAEYIVNMHIAGPYYLNFADCSPLAGARGVREYLFGKRVGSLPLMTLAARDWAAVLASDPDPDRLHHPDDSEGINLFYHIQAAMAEREVTDFAKTAAPAAPHDVWYPSVGILVSRRGAYALGGKAGSNADSLTAALEHARDTAEKEKKLRMPSPAPVSLDTFRDRLFLQLYGGLFTDRAVFDRQCAELGVTFKAPRHIVAVGSLQTPDLPTSQLVTLSTGVTRMAAETLPKYRPCRVTAMDLRHFSVLLPLEADEDPETVLAPILKTAGQILYNYFSTAIYWAVGRPVNDILKISESQHDAFAALPLLHEGEPVAFYHESPNTQLDHRAQVVGQVQQYIRDHLSERLTLNDVAAVFNFSPNYLSQLFAQNSESGFVEFVTATRITAAKELMASTDLKVYEISDKVGFDSAFYFSKVFKKLEGVSPREYMQRMKVSYVDAKDEATV